MRRVLRLIALTIPYLISIGIAVAVMNLESMKSSTESSYRRWYNEIRSPAYWYQLPFTTGFRKLTNNYVSIVVISQDEPEDVRHDICKQREFLATLLRALKATHPKVVVIDKWYEPSGCAKSESTSKLQEAMVEVSKENIPIVFGRGAYREEDLRAAWPNKFFELKKRGFHDPQLILKDTVPFEDLNRVGIVAGLIQSNADNRKIPLSWPVFSTFEMVGKRQPEAMDTLSVAAVKKFNPDQTILDAIANLQKKGKHPYTSFLDQERIQTYSAMDVICSSSLREETLNYCHRTNSDIQQSFNLSGRAVVIGQVDPEHTTDLHESVIGKVPGFILQANYIESLIDGRILKPVGPWYNLGLLIVCLGGIHLILTRWTGRPWVCFLSSLTLIGLIWVIVCIIILVFGYYVELLVPSVVGVALLNLGKGLGKEGTAR